MDNDQHPVEVDIIFVGGKLIFPSLFYASHPNSVSAGGTAGESQTGWPQTAYKL
jgi:hypothetical protein